ncbi:MAG TPA: hypothetical protein VK454_14300 [Myxococcaceae bacterium]|nr:hypothetical protein [Myxococcaceae bacterium]
MVRPKRVLRRALLVLLAAAAVAMGVVAWRAHTGGLRRRLLAETRERVDARYPRPVQLGAAVPGRFGDRAAAAWDALGLQQAHSTDVEFCRGVRDGEAPFSLAPASCLHELEEGRAALEGLLAATHAAEGGPPAGLGSLDLPAPESHPRTWVTAAYAAKMGALRLRGELARGEVEAALATCADLLALARDASLGTALEGRLAALTVSEVAFRPCAAALDAAPAASKRRGEEVLGRVAAGAPPFAATLADWSVVVRLRAFARYLGDALRGLPPVVQGWAAEGPRQAPLDLVDAIAVGDAWHRLQTHLDRIVAAARLPLAEAVEELTQLSGVKGGWPNPRDRVVFPELGRVAMSDARVRAQLLLLRRAAVVDALRAETGRWPSAEELPLELRSTPGHPLRIEASGWEAVLSDPSVPRGGLEVTVHADR